MKALIIDDERLARKELINLNNRQKKIIKNTKNISNFKDRLLE